MRQHFSDQLIKPFSAGYAKGTFELTNFSLIAGIVNAWEASDAVINKINFIGSLQQTPLFNCRKTNNPSVCSASGTLIFYYDSRRKGALPHLRRERIMLALYFLTFLAFIILVKYKIVERGHPDAGTEGPKKFYDSVSADGELTMKDLPARVEETSTVNALISGLYGMPYLMS